MQEKEYILIGAYAKDLKEKIVTFRSILNNYFPKTNKVNMTAWKMLQEFEEMRSQLHDLSCNEISDTADTIDIFYGCDETSNIYIKEQKEILKKTNWDYVKIKEYIKENKNETN